MKELGWFFFNVAIPLLPVFIVWAASWLTSDRSANKTVFSIIKDGQLFFYCTALTSVAIGDIRKAPTALETLPWTMGLITIVILSSVAFAIAANNPTAVREGKLGWSSIAMVVAAILTVFSFRSEAGLL
jgi:hypothetical protein